MLFGGEAALTTINMSEYQEAHTVSQLKGSPPGYVGYGRGGILTEAVRQRPYSVILLDEVEKAHRDVLDIFYQVFDRGTMRDGEGRDIDFRNCVILMTSNLGSAQIDEVTTDNPDIAQPALLDAIHEPLVKHFQPALLARFQTLVYRPLDVHAIASIVRLKLARSPTGCKGSTTSSSFATIRSSHRSRNCVSRVNRALAASTLSSISASCRPCRANSSRAWRREWRLRRFVSRVRKKAI